MFEPDPAVFDQLEAEAQAAAARHRDHHRWIDDVPHAERGAYIARRAELAREATEAARRAHEYARAARLAIAYNAMRGLPPLAPVPLDGRTT